MPLTLVGGVALRSFEDGGDVAAVVVGGGFANVAYLTGPALEAYTRWLGFDHPWVRPVLFTLGTLLTLFLAAVTLGGLAFGNMDMGPGF